MYILVNADKDKYDRPIDIYVSEPSETYEEFSNELFLKLFSEWGEPNKWYDEEKSKDKLKEIVKSGGEVYFDGPYKYNYDTDSNGNIIKLKSNCPSINEYCGESYVVHQV